jgi:hypothetical protein
MEALHLEQEGCGALAASPVRISPYPLFEDKCINPTPYTSMQIFINFSKN